MYIRSYGWVQNPSNFKNLKRVVQIFDADSAHYKNLRDFLIEELIVFPDLRNELIQKFENDKVSFTYFELVGTSKDKYGNVAKTRAVAVADSIIQITILPQSFDKTGRRWTDNWTADGYLRWALSLNFVEHNRDTDECSITALGLNFARSCEDSEEEKLILRKALLAYPPATRVLEILSTSQTGANKFLIGGLLGFKGEKGFTSYDEEMMLDWLCAATPDERKRIKSDIEGTSDKYARMIASWLTKVGFVKREQTTIKTDGDNISGFPHYLITGEGLHHYNRSIGFSSNAKIPKFITWEFLSGNIQNREYVRTRRAQILQIIQQTKSMNVLLRRLAQYGFHDTRRIIENDISGLNSIGIRILYNADENLIILQDNLHDFTIPQLNVTEEMANSVLADQRTQIMNNTNLPAKYYELIDMAYDGKRSRDFEMVTIDLLKNIYKFKAQILGGSRKPDGIIFSENYGVIVDTKAYGTGYAKSISEEDKMVRYIEDNQLRDTLRNPTEWWKAFDPHITFSAFYFMWISSKFVGQFSSQLESTFNRTGTYGAALNVEQLLYGAEYVNNNQLSLCDVEGYFCNAEIYWKV